MAPLPRSIQVYEGDGRKPSLLKGKPSSLVDFCKVYRRLNGKGIRREWLITEINEIAMWSYDQCRANLFDVDRIRAYVVCNGYTMLTPTRQCFNRWKKSKHG